MRNLAMPPRVSSCMRAMLLYLAVVSAVAPLMAQGPGPLRPRPQPPSNGASPHRLPPAPRIGQEPVEESREASRYLPPSDPVLAKAIAANIDFQQELPNFVCQERMTRSSSRDLGKKWKQDDVVEAEILTIGDKVEYRDIKVDGIPTGAADLSQIGGAWSVGEYGATVFNIFNPRSRTEFTKQGSDRVGDREALTYNYKIDEEHSDGGSPSTAGLRGLRITVRSGSTPRLGAHCAWKRRRPTCLTTFR